MTRTYSVMTSVRIPVRNQKKQVQEQRTQNRQESPKKLRLRCKSYAIASHIWERNLLSWGASEEVERQRQVVECRTDVDTSS